MSKIKLFNKEILKNKRLLALIFILIGTIFITLGYSYAYFNKVVIGSNVDLRVGTINYSLDSDGLNSNYQATVSAGSQAVIEVTVNGLDDFASKYQMYYTGSNLDDIVVGYSSESTDLPYGEMSAKGEKTVTIVIQNNSSSDVTVTIGVAGGLNKYTVNDIVLKDGQFRITEEIEVASFDIQLASVTIDGQKANSLPTSGTYELSNYTCSKGSTLEWDTYKKSITFSAGTQKGESCSLEFTSSTDYPLLIDKVKQGDYIAYEGNNGCLRNGTATASVTTSGQGANENSNSCLGYNANSDGSKDSTYGMYGYCYSSSYRYYVSGWRIAYTKDNRAYIISAGSPECTTRRNSTNGNTDYITDSYLDAKKYCNSSYVDDCTSDTDVHAINDTDYNLMTAEATNTTGGYLYTSISGATKCGGVYSKEVCGYNNDLIDNGGYYWFAAAYSASSTYGVFWNPYSRDVSNTSSTYANGLRPVIRLSSSVYITGGSGTMDDPYTIIKK